MICVLIGGAVALALWEPLAYLILQNTPDRGFFTFLEGVAWGAALILPFAITTALLRLAVDGIIRANVKVPPVADYVGGGVCGVVAGVISMGLVVTGMGHTRMGAAMFGYKPLTTSISTGLQKEAGLWLPADAITGAIYAHLSRGVLSTSTPLADWHPDFATAPAALRMSLGDGKGRNAMPVDAVTLLHTWTVGKDAGEQLQRLMTDKWNPAAQTSRRIDGEQFHPQSHIVGYMLRFGPGAREPRGNVVISEGQVRLVLRNRRTGSSMAVHPIAAVSPAAGETNPPIYARWRYGGPFHLSSVGGAADTLMGFEFIVEPGYEPIGLTVKNTRIRVDRTSEPIVFATPAERDRAIETGRILAGHGQAGTADLDRSAAERVGTQTAASGTSESGIVVGRNLPGRIIIQRGSHRTLQLDGNEIVSGSEAFNPEEVRRGFSIPMNLQIRQFQTTEDTTLVQVDVSLRSRQSLLGQAAAAAERVVPPVLIDRNGLRYEAVGYFYRDSSIVRLRYTPGNPIRGLTELERDGVALSRSAAEQELILLFRVSSGVEIERFVIGNTVIAEYSPPIEATRR